MAEEKDAKAEERTPAPAASRRTEALGEMVNAANALQAIQQQAAVEAMKLPSPRLDDASEAGGAPGYTLRQTGPDEFVRVDAEGRELRAATRADLTG